MPQPRGAWPGRQSAWPWRCRGSAGLEEFPCVFFFVCFQKQQSKTPLSFLVPSREAPRKQMGIRAHGCAGDGASEVAHCKPVPCPSLACPCRPAAHPPSCPRENAGSMAACHGLCLLLTCLRAGCCVRTKLAVWKSPSLCSGCVPGLPLACLHAPAPAPAPARPR